MNCSTSLIFLESVLPGLSLFVYLLDGWDAGYKLCGIESVCNFVTSQKVVQRSIRFGYHAQSHFQGCRNVEGPFPRYFRFLGRRPLPANSCDLAVKGVASEAHFHCIGNVVMFYAMDKSRVVLVMMRFSPQVFTELECSRPVSFSVSIPRFNSILDCSERGETCSVVADDIPSVIHLSFGIDGMA